MGNNLSTTGTGPASSSSAARQANGTGSGADSFLGELGGEVQYDKSMGTSRFLKTIRGRHKQGALVVKVFVKADPSVSLKAFHRRIKAEREALADCPNVLPYQRAIETERAGYLIRQWTASNLYDRISTRPFLSLMEKRWIAFQLLKGLQFARERNISHGDIKTENVGVSSWNWVYLTDFASFKPTYLPLDDPSTFSFFFDTSSRRTCYLAPERFYAPDSEMAKRKEGLEFGKKDGKVTEAMDVFALGCVFAELWMEGTPPFTLSQLFKYREGQYSPEPYLAEIEDVEIRNLIRSMLSLDPTHRLSCAEYLASYRNTAFPDIFYTFLHPFISSLNDISPSLPPPTPNASLAGKTTGTATPGGQSGDQQQQATLRSDADDRIERVWNEWEMISEYLERGRKGKKGEESAPGAAESSKEGREEDIFPLRLHIPGFEGQPVSGGVTEDGPALIILSLICSNIRNCVRPASIIRALDVLLALNRYLTDETKLDRLVPYLVTILQDEMAYVRSAAVKALTQTLLLITTLTPSNASLFPEYIFPNTRPFSTDPELLPRTTYAQCIASLATQAKRFLEMTEAMKTEGTFKLANVHEFGGEPFDENFDARLLELQTQVSDHLSPLLSDSSSVVKRALLTHVGTLCTFFGPARANDAILAHLVTYLNTRDWLLRAKWNEVAVEVAGCVGSRSLEEYILPLITMSLADAEEFVVVKVLATLTTLTERRFLTKGKTWELVAQITGFLCHPNIWIREGTAAFLASTAKRLSPTDCWCILYPTIKRLLRADIKEITELALLDNAREPLPRVIFEAAVAWAGRSGKSNFWSLPRGSAKGAPRDAGVRTDEDHAQLEKMRQLGMKPEDEFKLSMMREYISKLAISRQATPSRLYDAADSLTQSGGAQLQDLGIVPQTIFFSIRSADELSNEVSREAHALQQQHLRSDGIFRRFSLDTTPRSPGSLDRTVPSRNVSGGQPIEDLRRRLALAGGGSTTSLNSGALETASVAASEDAQSTTGGKGAIPERLDLHRTTSHASTDISDTTTSTRGADIVAAVPRSRVHHNAVEVGRAAPAVAEDSTNVMGLFNVDARYRGAADGEEDAMSAMTGIVSSAPYSRSGGRKPIAAQRFVSTYDGNDPSIKQLLERVYLDNYREPLPELGPHVPLGIPRRRALRTSFPPRERTPSRPEGTLIAHLVEHTAAITDIQVAPDQLFVATGSEDGTVKIWDTIRLEKNVTSRSRQTFQQGGRITAVCIVEHSHCVASASDNGTLWIHRVDVSLSGSMPKYGKQQLIRQQNAEQPGDFVTCIASYNTDTTTNLILGTSLSSIVILDIRTMRNLQTFANPLPFGPISCLCIDRKRVWLVVGTASGTLTLWDLRFGLLLRSWSVTKGRIHKIAVHPCRGKGRWIVVAMEEEGAEEKTGALVAEVWDIDRGTRVEEFKVVGPVPAVTPSSLTTTSHKAVPANGDLASTSAQEATLNPAAAIEALLSASTAPPKPRTRLSLPSSAANEQPTPAPSRSHPPGVRAFLVGTDYSMQSDARPSTTPSASGGLVDAGGVDGKKEVGYLITGGEDRKLRFWDLGRASKSAVVSGLDIDDEAPTFSVHTSSTRPNLFLESPPPSRTRSTTSNRVHRSTLIANSQQQLLRGHQEAITALAVIDLPFRCVVSGDRSGVVKVFE
ncbi:Other/VPS15 protein kinase [Leucosporidium creatinivorum]|uniref:non-specific serine/threonine protein kinase n=1 Tax=Leucosporidium creatinivorum TaxID=106004 RepID=A0A1Y2FGH1_9BASI|nr:Other/VPS15 protein kinase [Leucosporidium creatinivorum]